jgi:ABC-type uncharacterized transport system auxiliary subunit
MKSKLLPALGLLILLSGCMSEKAVITRHYTIEWADDRNTDDRNTEAGEHAWLIPGRCGIDQVEISPLYEKTQIVNRSGSHEISYYRYHQWAVRPAVAVMEVVRTYLEGAGMFENVSSRYSRAIPDYHFTSTIRQLELIESKNQFQAHLHIEFSLVRNSDGRILLEHRADRTTNLEKKELNLFAAAISDMLVSELRAFEDLFRTQLAQIKDPQ